MTYFRGIHRPGTLLFGFLSVGPCGVTNCAEITQNNHSHEIHWFGYTTILRKCWIQFSSRSFIDLEESSFQTGWHENLWFCSRSFQGPWRLSLRPLPVRPRQGRPKNHWPDTGFRFFSVNAFTCILVNAEKLVNQAEKALF